MSKQLKHAFINNLKFLYDLEEYNRRKVEVDGKIFIKCELLDEDYLLLIPEHYWSDILEER